MLVDENLEYQNGEIINEDECAQIHGVIIYCPILKKLILILNENLSNHGESMWPDEVAHYCSGHEYFTFNVDCQCGEAHTFRRD
jgi:hypothetical protein